MRAAPPTWLRARSLRALLAGPTVQDVVLPFAVQRTLLFLAVCFGVQLFGLAPLWGALPDRALLDPWIRWDSEHYLLVASVGYGHSHWGKPDAFFPLYPGLIRLVSLVLPLPVAALAVANAAALAAFGLLYRLVLALDGREAARRAVWLGLLFPTSFFLSAAYAESLYLACTIGAVLAWHRGARWLSAAAVVGACLARPQGVLVMSVPFLLHWLVQSRRAREIPWFSFATCLGAAVVFLIYEVAVGDPTAFVTSPTVRALRGLGGLDHGSPAPFWAVLLDEGMGPNLMRRLLNFGALALTLAVSVHFFRRKDVAFGTLTILTVAIPLAAHGTIFDAASMARYLMSAFPLYLALARWFPETTWDRGRTVEYGFGALQMVLAVLFGAGQWAE